ncbi:hypothetical protein [Carbonactinospora thermoautotrophica]|uniref:PH-like domain-containing protein n=1 Tax=Carbonactinospora thermoautotrophica TaxID=1469144 RepID=UPI00226D49BB|nr:hypothetical protein [Carbonactinospora thermoautotrophica]
MTGHRIAAESAPVTQLGERLAWTTLMVLVILGLYLLMWRAWKRRAARQAAELPPLPKPPAEPGEPLASAAGIYVSTTSEGDWLDRIVAHGLGARSRAELTVTPQGVLFAREGAPAVYIPAARIRGVRRERGMAGKFVEEGGLLVITWEHGSRTLDTGFRAERVAEHDAVEHAVAGLVPAGGGA